MIGQPGGSVQTRPRARESQPPGQGVGKNLGTEAGDSPRLGIKPSAAAITSVRASSAVESVVLRLPVHVAVYAASASISDPARRRSNRDRTPHLGIARDQAPPASSSASRGHRGRIGSCFSGTSARPPISACSRSTVSDPRHRQPSMIRWTSLPHSSPAPICQLLTSESVAETVRFPRERLEVPHVLYIHPSPCWPASAICSSREAAACTMS